MDETIRKSQNQLDLSIIENGKKRNIRPSIIEAFVKGEELPEHWQKQIDLLSPKQKKLLTKKNLEKAAKEFDERQKLEQDVRDAKRKLAEDKLADLGLTKEDLMELLRS